MLFRKEGGGIKTSYFALLQFPYSYKQWKQLERLFSKFFFNWAKLATLYDVLSSSLNSSSTTKWKNDILSTDLLTWTCFLMNIFSFKKGRKTPTCYATLYCRMLHTPACIPVKIKTCTLYYMYHKTNIVFIKAKQFKFNIHASFIFPMNIKQYSTLY